MNIIFAFLAAVITFCSILLVNSMMLERKRRASVGTRLAPDGTFYSVGSEPLLVGMHNEPSARAQAIAKLLRAIGVSVDDAVRKLDRRFAHAGIASADAPILYLFCQRILVLPLCAVALMFFLSNGAGADRLLNLMVGGMFLVAGLFGPHLWLENNIARRKKILQRAFPDTLDLLLICVESGLALDAALNRVCAELGTAYPEMTEELNRTRLELALINDRVRALMNLGERTNMVAFRSLVATLIQSERFGTSLTDTMRVLSEDFRLQRLSEVEAKAARLPVLLTIPLILMLMPALFIIVLGPAMMGINTSGM